MTKKFKKTNVSSRSVDEELTSEEDPYRIIKGAFIPWWCRNPPIQKIPDKGSCIFPPLRLGNGYSLENRKYVQIQSSCAATKKSSNLNKSKGGGQNRNPELFRNNRFTSPGSGLPIENRSKKIKPTKKKKTTSATNVSSTTSKSIGSYYSPCPAPPSSPCLKAGSCKSCNSKSTARKTDSTKRTPPYSVSSSVSLNATRNFSTQQHWSTSSPLKPKASISTIDPPGQDEKTSHGKKPTARRRSSYSVTSSNSSHVSIRPHMCSFNKVEPKTCKIGVSVAEKGTSTGCTVCDNMRKKIVRRRAVHVAPARVWPEKRLVKKQKMCKGAMMAGPLGAALRDNYASRMAAEYLVRVGELTLKNDPPGLKPNDALLNIIHWRNWSGNI